MTRVETDYLFEVSIRLVVIKIVKRFDPAASQRVEFRLIICFGRTCLRLLRANAHRGQ
jgi:hypothetical protein